MRISFEDTIDDASAVRFVPDGAGVRVDPDIKLTGYFLGKPRLEFADKRYDTDFGDLTLADASTYSRGTVVIPIERPFLAYAIKSLTPIVLIVLCAALVFFIHPSYVEARIGMGITALLTMVALQLTTASSLPSVDYLMMIDILYFLAYLFIVVSIALVVRNGWYAESGDIARAIELDRIAISTVLTMYVILNVGWI